MVSATSARQRLPVPLIAVTGLLCLGFPAHAEQSLPSRQQLVHLEATEVVAPVVAADLAREGLARVEVTLQLPTPEDRYYVGHHAWSTDINPLLFDLVLLAEPGSIEMIDRGPVTRLAADLNTGAVLMLADNPHVLAIGPVTRLVSPAKSTPDRVLGGCSSSSTTACLLSSTFAVTSTNVDESQNLVAVTSSLSAVFYRNNSHNWEILVKVLDGCSINNHVWVFAAGATSISASIDVENTDTSDSVSYSTSTCPVTDTTAFDCPT